MGKVRMDIPPTHLRTHQLSTRQRFRVRWLTFSILGALPGLLTALLFTTGYADVLMAPPGMTIQDTVWLRLGFLLLPGLLTGLGVGWGQRRATRQWLPRLWPFASAAIYSAAWCVIAFEESLDIGFLHRIDVPKILLLTAFLLAVAAYLVLPLVLAVVKLSDRQLRLLDRSVDDNEYYIVYLLLLFVVLPVWGLVRLHELAQPSSFTLIATATLFLGVVLQAGAALLLMRDTKTPTS